MSARLQVLEALDDGPVVSPAGSHIVEHLIAPFRELLDADGVSEVCVNRPGQIWVMRAGRWHCEARPTLTFERLRGIAGAIANFSGQRCDAEHPLLSCTLPTRERVQLVVPPAVEPNTIVMAFRNPAGKTYSLEEYAARGSFARIGEHERDERLQRALVDLVAAKQWVEFQRLAVDAHLTILACGETGSGKTTYLNSLCSYIDPSERLITIEDAREMWFPKQANSVHLLYSHGGQGEAKVTSSDLLKACMRLRPDRILPAELRGGEAYDFVDAAFSGHRGSMSTLHAGDSVSALMRFVGLLREADKCKSQSERELKLLAWCSIDALVIWDKPRDGQPIVADIHYDPLQRQRARDAFMALS